MKQTCLVTFNGSAREVRQQKALIESAGDRVKPLPTEEELIKLIQNSFNSWDAAKAVTKRLSE